ncbi:MAG: DUF5320 domain-containing protein [Anaerolineales bacterium]|nr:DUF5320 domain-containing protein [Anaerolineales bacterium]
MPAGDRTGPYGEGARTGRSAGYCSGYNQPGYANVFPGRGMGAGWGRGRGGDRRPGRGAGFGRRGPGSAWGPGYGYRTLGPTPAVQPLQPDPEFEHQQLKQQADWLKNQLESIEKKLADLETDE